MSEQSNQGAHQGQSLFSFGKALNESGAAMILIHGRGATAPSILELAQVLPHEDMAYLAPQAANNTWYPNSFLSPIASNEPQLSSALQVIADLVRQIEGEGIPTQNIIIGGFSQGACLASEFVARHARRYGGVLIFSGGVIGPPGTPRDYEGSLAGTPVFVGCSDTDFHIPAERVHETADVLARLGGAVDKQIYPGMDHTIIQDEIDRAQQIVEQVGISAQ